MKRQTLTLLIAAAFGLDEAFHHFLALGAGKVAGLAARDGDVCQRDVVTAQLDWSHRGQAQAR